MPPPNYTLSMRLPDSAVEAAGVLPWCPRTNTFLLCREKPVVGWKDSRKWSDFGGHRDSPAETPMQIAAREFYEESLGLLFPSIDATLEHMRAPGNVVYVNDTPLGHGRVFRMYVVRLARDTGSALADRYTRAIAFLRFCHPNAEKWIEKDRVCWIAARDLWANVYGMPDAPHPRRVLRMAFAQSLYRMGADVPGFRLEDENLN